MTPIWLRCAMQRAAQQQPPSPASAGSGCASNLPSVPAVAPPGCARLGRGILLTQRRSRLTVGKGAVQVASALF